MGEKVLPRGGLLSGGIGGAAQGILDVAKLSLEERAETRKEELAAKVALYKASQKKTGSSDDKPKNPWQFKYVPKYGEDGATIGQDVFYENDETGQRLKAYPEDEVNLYEADFRYLIEERDMSPTEAYKIIKDKWQGKNPDHKVPEGMGEFIMALRGVKRGGTRPPIKSPSTATNPKERTPLWTGGDEPGTQVDATPNVVKTRGNPTGVSAPTKPSRGNPTGTPLR